MTGIIEFYVTVAEMEECVVALKCIGKVNVLGSHPNICPNVGQRVHGIDDSAPGPSASWTGGYSDVILRLIELEAGKPPYRPNCEGLRSGLESDASCRPDEACAPLISCTQRGPVGAFATSLESRGSIQPAFA